MTVTRMAETGMAVTGMAATTVTATTVTKTRMTCAIIVALLCLTVPALAEDDMPDSEHGRYSFSKVADGVVRLDTQTGAVSVCSQRTVGWACQAAPDDRTVLEGEIARLRTENATLKQQLLAHNLPLPGISAPEASSPPVASNGDGAPKAENNAENKAENKTENKAENKAENKTENKAENKAGDADIDRMVEIAGRLWHRFVDAIARAQRQVLKDKS